MTKSQLTFALWELARSREVQEKLRTEVNEAWEKVKARGDSEFVANDLENMPYLVAVVKVRHGAFSHPTGVSDQSASRKP